MSLDAEQAGLENKSLGASEGQPEVDGESQLPPEASTEETAAEPETTTEESPEEPETIPEPQAEMETTDAEPEPEPEPEPDAAAEDAVAKVTEHDRALREQYDSTHDLALRGGDNPTGRGTV